MTVDNGSFSYKHPILENTKIFKIKKRITAFWRFKLINMQIFCNTDNVLNLFCVFAVLYYNKQILKIFLSGLSYVSPFYTLPRRREGELVRLSCYRSGRSNHNLLDLDQINYTTEVSCH
jgi:hypothetical protein